MNEKIKKKIRTVPKNNQTFVETPNRNCWARTEEAKVEIKKDIEKSENRVLTVIRDLIEQVAGSNAEKIKKSLLTNSQNRDTTLTSISN